MGRAGLVGWGEGASQEEDEVVVVLEGGEDGGRGEAEGGEEV